MSREDLRFWAKFFGKGYRLVDALSIIRLVAEMGEKLKEAKC